MDVRPTITYGLVACFVTEIEKETLMADEIDGC